MTNTRFAGTLLITLEAEVSVCQGHDHISRLLLANTYLDSSLFTPKTAPTALGVP